MNKVCKDINDRKARKFQDYIISLRVFIFFDVVKLVAVLFLACPFADAAATPLLLLLFLFGVGVLLLVFFGLYLSTLLMQLDRIEPED